MELFVGALVSLLVLVARKVSQRFGLEASRLALLGATLVLSIGAAVAQRYAPEPIWQEAVAIFTGAIGFYEVVVKTAVMPALSALKKEPQQG